MKTKQMGLLGRLATAGMVGLAALLPGKAEGQVSGSLAVKDRYVATPGFVIGEDPVVQTSISYNRDGFYGLLWSNFNTKEGKINEVDYVIGYGGNFLGINFDASYNVFDLKGAGDIHDDLYELWLRLSKFGTVSPSLTLVQNLSATGDLEAGDGRNYAILGLSHSGRVGRIPVSLEGSLQFNNEYFSENSGFSIAQANLGIPLTFGDVLVTPGVRFRWAIDGDNFKDETDFVISLNR